MALRVIGAPQSKVYIPPICFRAVWNAVRQINATPVHHAPWDYAIVVMNYGFPFPSIRYPAEIVDASEALGGKISTRYSLVILSFNWNKPITCGSGGMVLCKSERDQNQMRLWANQCKVDSTYFKHTNTVGYNYRMNDLQATMGMESLATWPENYKRKKAIYTRYLRADLPVVKPPKDFKWNYWITLLRTPKREKVLQAFRENDIETRAMFTPHTREFPEVNKFADETMCLPSSPGLTEEEQAKVIRVVKEALK